MRDFDFTLPGGRKISMTAPDHLFIPRILASEGISSYELHTLACALAVCSVRDGAFYDVGANVGLYSILIAGTLERQCFAFEPTPEPAVVLRETVARNGLFVSSGELALSNKAGRATFYLSDRSDMSNSLNQAFRRSANGIDVEISTLDLVVDATPALFKIDTESTEPDVLAGAAEVIRRYAPPFIVEVLHGRTEDRLNAFLRENGYGAYHIAPGSWERRESVTGDPTHTNTNWLFSRDPMPEEFWIYLDAWRWRLMCLSQSS